MGREQRKGCVDQEINRNTKGKRRVKECWGTGIKGAGGTVFRDVRGKGRPGKGKTWGKKNKPKTKVNGGKGGRGKKSEGGQQGGCMGRGETGGRGFKWEKYEHIYIGREEGGRGGARDRSPIGVTRA